MLNRNDIKVKAWEKIEGFIELNNDDFNQCAYSFKISDNFNLVVWCDVDYEFNENEPRYFIVSIRYNPYDELFGDDIGVEYCTNSTTEEELNKTIDNLLDSLEGKKLIKNTQGDYHLVNI